MLQLKYINMIHIFVIGIILLLLGIYKQGSCKVLYYLLGILALSIPILVPLPKEQLNYWNTIRLTHYFILLPFLLYIAFMQNSLSNGMYDLLLLISTVIIVYHSYKLYTQKN